MRQTDFSARSFWFRLFQARRAAREEGMLVGISSGATLAAIAQKLPELPEGATVLGFNYDTGERYLSTFLFEGINEGSDDEWLASLGPGGNPA